MNDVFDFYNGKRVLITGHTGFKGTWLSRILLNAGAEVIGYSLRAQTKPNLFDIAGIENRMNSIIGDIRDYNHLLRVMIDYRPEIVFHMAAQPIVRDSYKEPLYTYETNVMGTVNLCETIRSNNCVKSFVNITTDKVYKNVEREAGYNEEEPLDGYDPYSNSKSCSELVTHSYYNSFFKKMGVAVSTARAGNVIGGGDFANDRIIPDCVRAAENGDVIGVRNPYSIRPYQHVLEALNAYMMISKKQYDNSNYSGWYNVGPNDSDCITTGKLVDLFCDKWNILADDSNKLNWESKAEEQAPHEATFLKLDCNKFKAVFGWEPQWDIDKAVEKTARWSYIYLTGGNVIKCMDEQIEEFFK